jgi:transcriptional regulator with PAS, ATPase and Fis domain
LEKLVEEKGFREDLFYRLNVIRLELPPLKDRKGDIPLLIDHIMKRLSAVKNPKVDKISEEAMETLLNYDYPGNIRELENILEHALIICQDNIIKCRHLPLFLQRKSFPGGPSETPAPNGAPLASRGEKDRIVEMLNRNSWHRGKTARGLNMDRTTLWRKMKKYNLSS